MPTATTTTTTNSTSRTAQTANNTVKSRTMATHHSRHRSASDPFNDLNQPSNHRSKPPPPPPKSAHKPRMTAATTDKKLDQQRDRQDPTSPRTRMGRSHTAVPPTRDSPSRPAHTGRRSQSQDSVLAAAAAVERAKTTVNGKRSKKSSQHADVIDRLDYSAVGLFHHDGPFDACAPSRNRQKNKAPMLAWSPNPDDAKQFAASNTNSPYPSANAYAAFSQNAYPEQPKKKVDAIAEAWGIHEPEPYEEFFAGGGTKSETPASSIYNGRDAHSSRKRGKDELAPPVPHVGRSRTNRRSAVPPPQPIMVPDASTDIDAPMVSPPANGNAPKRSKSLMQRIRKMRDAPNVPVNNDYSDNGATPPSPSSPNTDSYSGAASARPGHRSQNSFLGRFNPKGHHQPQLSTPAEQQEPFVLINNANGNVPAHASAKDLPATPATAGLTPSAEGAGGYFEPALHSPGLGRKVSLMKKVRGVVKGTKRE
ncbi:hypothetical protein HGRIS_007992 [Hohenbuehelia grisea]|uniref:Uncharacterized protein n=1 Tax=Hohenbuehelia grisea TaxID=104357 RepID=A0ABR3J7C5_9AGAR